MTVWAVRAPMSSYNALVFCIITCKEGLHENVRARQGVWAASWCRKARAAVQYQCFFTFSHTMVRRPCSLPCRHMSSRPAQALRAEAGRMLRFHACLGLCHLQLL